jgi:hypothetical protein
MLVIREYNRENALAYARRWAFARNPLYYDYAGIGGNCTNFVSQCLYAGSCTMNYIPLYGWYYLSPAERTPSWTGVEFFYNFITGNASVGPFAEETGPEALEIGDVVQLGREEGGYYHTLLVVGRAGEDLLLAANTNDAFERPLSSYEYDYARFLHVLGVRIEVPNTADCFTSLLEGVAILPDSASRPPLPPPDKNPPQDGENAPPPAEMPEVNSEEGREETATPAENPDQTASMPVFLPAPPPYRPA